jgi:hypothetical protein
MSKRVQTGLRRQRYKPGLGPVRAHTAKWRTSLPLQIPSLTIATYKYNDCGHMRDQEQCMALLSEIFRGHPPRSPRIQVESTSNEAGARSRERLPGESLQLGAGKTTQACLVGLTHDGQVMQRLQQGVRLKTVEHAAWHKCLATSSILEIALSDMHGCRPQHDSY